MKLRIYFIIFSNVLMYVYQIQELHVCMYVCMYENISYQIKVLFNLIHCSMSQIKTNLSIFNVVNYYVLPLKDQPPWLTCNSYLQPFTVLVPIILSIMLFVYQYTARLHKYFLYTITLVMRIISETLSFRCHCPHNTCISKLCVPRYVKILLFTL